MEVIAHRRNRVEDLRDTPTSHGVEIDIRTFGGRLVLNHEPFEDGTAFEEWLRFYNHGTLILNVKEDGLEDRVLALLAEHGIDQFFFLDQPMPTLIKWGRQGERRSAVRVSEFEPVDGALAVAPYVDWVWIDCFTRFPLDRQALEDLKAAGLSLCIVSPELQGRSDDMLVREFIVEFRRRGVIPDAVCTKRADLWAP
jgi:hypothetical protein